MKLEAVELRRLQLPLVTPFVTHLGDQRTRDLLLLRALAADAEGWGECVAMNEPGYSEEHVDRAHATIRDDLLPRVFARGVDALAEVAGHPMAKAAIEMTLLDAELRAAGTRLADHLGATRASVDAGVVVGIAADLDRLCAAVADAIDEGYRRVKLKIAPGWDVDPVRAVRERFGDALVLQVDANRAYTMADVDRLAALDPFCLAMIEEPLADDLAGHAALATRITTPVCLDESITSAAVARTAIEMGACAVVNIKPGRVGGLAEAVRVHDVCVERGVPAWCGGMLETGVGRAANVALAALPGFTLPGDLSASARYYDPDITAPFVLRDGRLAVPTGPGIGVTPIAEIVDRATVSRELIRAP